MSIVPAAMPGRRRHAAFNPGPEEIPAHAAVEWSVVNAEGAFVLRKPDKDDSPTAFFNTETAIAVNGYGFITKHLPTWALYHAADGNPSNGESLGTRAGFWELYRGYEGFLVWGGADGEKVYVQSDLTCRETGGTGGYYYTPTFENPCCGLPLPRTICLNHIGSASHDGGITLDFWNACYAGRPSYASTVGGVASDGLTPPPWIPDLRTSPIVSGHTGSIHDYWPFIWENILSLGCDTSITSIDAASPGRKNWLPTWWSPVYHDFDCANFETSEGVISSSGIFTTVHKYAEESEYYSFYVFMNLDYPQITYSIFGGVQTSKRCALTFVQLKKSKITYSSQARTSGVPSGPWVVRHNISWPDKDWCQIMYQQGYREQGDYSLTQQNCKNTLTCDPFSMQVYMKHKGTTTFFSPPGVGDWTDYALYLTEIQAVCPTYDMVTNMFGFAFVTQLNPDTANELSATCTEDQDCHLEWQITGYPIIGYIDDDPEQPIYDYDNPIYGWVTVCTGTGTYTASGPRVDLFICANGDPFPPPADPINAQADTFQEDTFQ